MEVTYTNVSGHWKHLYRAVDRDGDTVDFLLIPNRDKAAARRFLEAAIDLRDLPENITIDKSGANTAAIESVEADVCIDIPMRQSKYHNNIVEQDHRAVKRITRPMLGFKLLWSARIILQLQYHHRRNRNHAHDQAGADRLSRRTNHVRSQPTLPRCRLIIATIKQLFSARPHKCNTPRIAYMFVVKWILITLVVLILMSAGVGQMGFLAGKDPTDLGVKNGRLSHRR